MSCVSVNRMPVITIQCDWNEVIRLPNCEVWMSSKYLNETSTHTTLRTLVNGSDGKIKLNLSDSFQYISHTNLCLVVKHIASGLKVAFVAPTKTYSVHSKGALSISAAENALAVSSCEADKLLVWDSRTGEVLQDLKGHGGPIYKCRFFPSGVVVISAGADGSCRIWSAESGINPVILKGHKMAVTDLSIIEKGRNVVTVSKDGKAKLWDVGQSTCLDNVLEDIPSINCCAIGITTNEIDVENDREIGTENKILIVGCESGDLFGCHIGKRHRIFHKTLQSPCNACIVMDQAIIIGLHDGKLLLLNLADGSILKEWHESASPVLSLAILPNDMFIVGRQDGTCTLFSLQPTHASTRVQLTGADCDGIRDIAFNGKWILTACRDCTIKKYDFNQIVIHFK